MRANSTAGYAVLEYFGALDATALAINVNYRRTEPVGKTCLLEARPCARVCRQGIRGESRPFPQIALLRLQNTIAALSNELRLLACLSVGLPSQLCLLVSSMVISAPLYASTVS